MTPRVLFNSFLYYAAACLVDYAARAPGWMKPAGTAAAAGLVILFFYLDLCLKSRFYFIAAKESGRKNDFGRCAGLLLPGAACFLFMNVALYWAPGYLIARFLSFFYEGLDLRGLLHLPLHSALMACVLTVHSTAIAFLFALLVADRRGGSGSVAPVYRLWIKAFAIPLELARPWTLRDRTARDTAVRMFLLAATLNAAKFYFYTVSGFSACGGPGCIPRINLMHPATYVVSTLLFLTALEFILEFRGHDRNSP